VFDLKLRVSRRKHNKRRKLGYWISNLVLREMWSGTWKSTHT